ncbi:MAG TPA: phosphatidylinositol mannoside acyltransferase [Actinomycetota bacterium]|nr:phosphatidylinositol mannoside acyltransferase [Actinomycetota bacterium]
MIRAPGETWGEAATYLRFALMRWLGRHLPTHTGRALAKLGGTIAYHLASGARAVVAANQAQVLGRPPEDPLVQGSVREAFQLYARFWFDVFHIGTWDDRRLLDAVNFEGLDVLHEAREAGAGVVITLPHSGNYDVAGRAVVASGIPVVAVAEQLKPDRLADMFHAERAEGLGLEIVPLRAEAHVGQRLATALAANKAIALLADRDLNGRGTKVDLFGRPHRFPIGPAMLAIQSGAPIVIAETYQTPTGWTVRMRRMHDVPRTGERRTDVTATIAALAGVFEETISAAPADWHMFQPCWED